MSEQHPQPQGQIGTPEEQTVHRPPAPSVAEHNEWMREHRPNDCVGKP